MSIQVGYQGKVYINTSSIGTTRTSWGGSLTNGIYVGSAPGGLTEATFVRSVKLGDQFGEADGTTRASGGFKISIPALEELEIDIEFPWQPTDTNFQALRSAKAQRLTIPVAVLDGQDTVSGSSGVWADFVVIDFPRDEPEDKEMLCTAKLKPGPSSLGPQAVQVQ